MKKQFARLGLMVLSLSLVFASCKKESSGTDLTTEVSTQSDDQSQFSSDVDAVSNDVNLALETESGFAARNTQTQTLICNATVVVDTMNNPRTITVTYNGADCFGYTTRTGSIVISMPSNTRWRNPGAAVTVTYHQLHITRISDNKSITINGSHVITNVSGGLLVNLPTLQTITHTITSSHMSVKFDNNTERSWQVARQRVFTYSGGVVVTITGTHSEGGVTGIAEWGTNRFGSSFTSSIAQPLVIRQDCNLRLVSGKVAHKTSRINASATFGLDATGNPTACPGAGNYYLKIEWTGPAGNTQSRILPY
jgi:outer membrane murein-binding lipoprotein Lpp